MPETELILLIIAVLLLGWLVWQAGRILSRIRAIDARLSEIQNASADKDDGASPAEPRSGGAFEMFLTEDPARRELSKSEQFAAFRKWRNEKGLNWTGS